MSIAPVLARIDADLSNALERLFALVRIPSISTDLAYAGDVAACAEAFRADLAGMGFEASVRATPGHPVVVAHRRKPGARHVLFTVITTSSRSISSPCGRRRRSMRR